MLVKKYLRDHSSKRDFVLVVDTHSHFVPLKNVLVAHGWHPCLIEPTSYGN